MSVKLHQARCAGLAKILTDNPDVSFIADHVEVEPRELNGTADDAPFNHPYLVALCAGYDDGTGVIDWETVDVQGCATEEEAAKVVADHVFADAASEYLHTATVVNLDVGAELEWETVQSVVIGPPKADKPARAPDPDDHAPVNHLRITLHDEHGAAVEDHPGIHRVKAADLAKEFVLAHGSDPKSAGGTISFGPS